MLVNAPLVDQLNEPSGPDGGPDESAVSNCVPASLSSGIRALIPSLSAQQVNGDQLRDAVYGEGSVGGTDPVRYIPYLNSAYHIATSEFDSPDGWALVHTIVAGLQRHEPVTGAIPSMWATAPADPVHAVGGTHEVLWCDFDGANLTAMNPWPEPPTNNAFYQTQPLAWWAARIVYGRVFTLAKEQPMSYTKNPDGSISYPNGVTLHTATAAYVEANNISATPLQAQAYLGSQYGYTPFDDGTILVWDGAQQRIRTDLGGVIVAGLCKALASATAPAPDAAAEHALSQVQAIAAILAH